MSRFKDWKYPEFDENGWTKYGWCCPRHFNLKLGKNTDIGFGCFIDATHEVIIEDDVQIAGHCLIYTHNTNPRTPMEGKVIIEKDVYIGSYTLILPNVVIKEGEYISERITVYINKKGERIIK